MRCAYATNADFVRNFRRFTAGDEPELPPHLTHRPEPSGEDALIELMELFNDQFASLSGHDVSPEEAEDADLLLSEWLDRCLPNVRYYLWSGKLFNCGPRIAFQGGSDGHWVVFNAGGTVAWTTNLVDVAADNFPSPSSLWMWETSMAVVDEDRQGVWGECLFRQEAVRLSLPATLRTWVQYYRSAVPLSEYFAWQIARTLLSSGVLSSSQADLVNLRNQSG